MGLPGTQLVHRNARIERNQRMPKSEVDIRASLEDVLHDVERNKRIYGWFAGNVGTLASETSNLAHRVEQRFDVVESRFEAVDRRFDAVDQRFEAVDKRFEAVDKRFDAVEERVDSLEMTTRAGFDRIDERFDTVDKRLGLLEDSSRQTLAQLERLSGYIIRDELKAGELAREEVTDVVR